MRDARLLSLFNDGPPPPGEPLQLLCEDHTGHYVLPFPCEWRDGGWTILKTTKTLHVKVVGWRPTGVGRQCRPRKPH